MAIKAVISGGGAGAKMTNVLMMVEVMKNFSKKEQYEPVDITLSYKDQGCEDRKKVQRETDIENNLRDADHSSMLIHSSGSRSVIDITKIIRERQKHPDQVPFSAEWMCRNGKTPMDVDKLDLIKTAFEQAVHTGFGYFQRPGLASVITNTAAPYNKIIEKWVERMIGGEELFLVIPIGIQGAEGIGTAIGVLSMLQNTIHNKCIEAGMTLDQEKQMIESKRHVCVLAIGGYKPPSTGTVLAKDYKLRSTQILASISEISKDKADGLIYVASDDPVVISGKQCALGGDQDYKSSLIFLQAAKVVELWNEGKFKPESLRNSNGLNILVDPMDTLGQNGTLSYTDLALPEGWKEMIASHISFAAAFLLGIKPMINGGTENIKYQPLFRNVFGKALRDFSDEEMEKEIIAPITFLAELLLENLGMLHEISATGTDWIRKPVQYEYSMVSLFNGPELAEVIRKARENSGDNVTYDLAKLTSFSDGEERNVRPDSLYLDKVIAKVIDDSEHRKGFLIKRGEPSMDIFKAFRCLYEEVRLSAKGE